MNDNPYDLSDFSGTARLFPLPGLTFFPHAVQPLHIFEPRYRQMTSDALDGDRLIAITLLQPGWEQYYDDRPKVAPVACLGRIVAEQLLPDGRYNLLLRGIKRILIVDEVATDKLYRMAQVEVLDDIVGEDIDELITLRNALADEVLPRFGEGPVREQLSDLFKGEMPLGHLCDVLTFALPIACEVKQKLLETLIVTDRARQLIEAFHHAVQSTYAKTKTTTASPGKKFPPEFSAN